MSVSVLILTLNEEVNLPGCLESVSWSDDIVVFDSFSTDKTVEIAKQFGARVVQRKFDNWSSHQNWAVENIDFKHPWVYYTDADERLPTELKDELLTIAAMENNKKSAYRLRYKNFFWDKWINKSGFNSTWVLRFFQPSKVRWERLVNPVAIVDGQEGKLNAWFEHYSFNRGFEHWFKKHNDYSTNEAVELINVALMPINWRVLVGSDYVSKRSELKKLAFRIPLRPLWVFIYFYFIKFYILHGWAGLTYCRLRSIYEYMIDLKVKELRRRQKGLPF